MKISKYILIAIFSIMFLTNAHAKQINVVALGEGEDYDWAMLNALENATKMATGNKTNSPSVIEEMKKNFVNISVNNGKVSTVFDEAGNLNGNISSQIKTIETYYNGEIKSFNVKSMEKKNNKTYITLDAVIDAGTTVTVVEEKVSPTIKTTTITEEYVSPNLVQKPTYKIAVMPFKGLRTYSCGKASIPLSTVNHNIASSLNSKISKTNLFSVLSRGDLYEYNSEMEIAASDLSKIRDKAKLGNLATADYMIIGTINEFQSFTNTKNIEPTGETYSNNFAKIVVNYSLVETATMEIIFSDIAVASINTQGEAVSCEKLLRDLADELSISIVRNTTKVVFPEYTYIETKTIESVPEQNIETVNKTIKTTTTTTREVVKLPYDK